MSIISLFLRQFRNIVQVNIRQTDTYNGRDEGGSRYKVRGRVYVGLHKREFCHRGVLDEYVSICKPSSGITTH